MRPAVGEPITFPLDPSFNHRKQTSTVSPAGQITNAVRGLQLDLDPPHRQRTPYSPHPTVYHGSASAVPRRVASMASIAPQSRQAPSINDSSDVFPISPKPARQLNIPNVSLSRPRSPSCPTKLPSALRRQCIDLPVVGPSPPPFPKQITFAPFSPIMVGSSSLSPEEQSSAGADSSVTASSVTLIEPPCSELPSNAAMVRSGQDMQLRSKSYQSAQTSPVNILPNFGSNVFFSALPSHMTAQDLYDLTQPFGIILSHRLSQLTATRVTVEDRSALSSSFQNPFEASNCIRSLLSIGIRCEYGKETYHTLLKKLEDPTSCAVHIANFPPHLTEDDLSKLLYPWIIVKTRMLGTEDVIKIKGRAIVTLQTRKDACDVIQRFHQFAFPGTSHVLDVTMADSASQRLFKREFPSPLSFKGPGVKDCDRQLRQYHMAQAHELEKRLLEGDRLRRRSVPANIGSVHSPSIRSRIPNCPSQTEFQVQSGRSVQPFGGLPSPSTMQRDSQRGRITQRHSFRDLRHVPSSPDLWQSGSDTRLLWPPAAE